VAARIVAWDGSALLVGLNAVSPTVLLPTLAAVVAAAALRRLAVLLTGVVILSVQFAFAVPELAASRPIPRVAHTATRLRLFDANVQAGNRDVAGYGKEILADQPDIVILEEASPRFVAGLNATGALTELSHRTTVDRDDPFAFAIFARFPLLDTDIVTVKGRPILVRTTIETPTGAQRLFVVHTVAPIGGLRREWEQDLDAVRAAATTQAGSLLIVGDFNATWGNRAFRRLLSSGLDDAAAAQGHPWQMTWPRNHRFVPPMLRIDHVLTRGRPVIDISSGRGAGSDHRPLRATVALTS
jgi:endonuclease/exonuclease/phosphatase (EEP) superfamily protein YafD